MTLAVTSTEVYTSQGVNITVTGIAQVLQHVFILILFIYNQTCENVVG